MDMKAELATVKPNVTVLDQLQNLARLTVRWRISDWPMWWKYTSWHYLAHVCQLPHAWQH